MDEARIVSNEWKREKVVVVGGAGERRRRRRGGVFSFHPSGGSLGILSAGWIRNISSCSIRTVSPSAGWPSSIPFLFFFFYLIPFYPSTLSLSSAFSNSSFWCLSFWHAAERHPPHSRRVVSVCRMMTCGSTTTEKKKTFREKRAEKRRAGERFPWDHQWGQTFSPLFWIFQRRINFHFLQQSNPKKKREESPVRWLSSVQGPSSFPFSAGLRSPSVRQAFPFDAPHGEDATLQLSFFLSFPSKDILFLFLFTICF